jgi:hypothetical protein
LIAAVSCCLEPGRLERRRCAAATSPAISLSALPGTPGDRQVIDQSALHRGLPLTGCNRARPAASMARQVRLSIRSPTPAAASRQRRLLFISDAEVARLYAIYGSEGLEALDDTGQGRIAALVNNVMGIYENAYFARGYGIIGDEEWVRFQAGACIHYQKAVENKLSLRFTTPGFRQYLDESWRSQPAD